MTYVAIDEILAEVESQIQQVVGVAPVPVKSPTPAPPQPAASTYLTGLVNVMRSGMGIAPVDPNAPVSATFFDSEVAFNVEILGNNLRQGLSDLAAGVVGDHAYALQVAEYFAALAANGTAGSAGAAEAYAAALFAQAERDVSTVQGQAFHWAVNAQNNAVGVAQGLHAQDQADIAAVQAQGLAEATAAQNNAVGVAQGLHAQDQADIAATLSQALAWATSAQNNAAGLAQGLFNKVEQDLGTVANNADVFALSAAAAAAAASSTQLETKLQPQIDRLKTEADTCLAPLCDEVAPNAGTLGKLGKALTMFRDLGVAGLLVALAAEAAHDPEGSAHALDGALGWTSGIAMDIEHAVLG